MKVVRVLFLCMILFSIQTLYSQNKNKNSSITIDNEWARPAAEHANSALYFIIKNKGNIADTLIAAESKIADIVQIHESFKRDNDRMGMREVEFVAVPPKSKVEFKAGGYHVMLIDTQKDLTIGSTFEAALQFKHAGKIKIKATVKNSSDMNSTMH